MIATGLIDMDSCGDASVFSAGAQAIWVSSLGGGPQMSTSFGTFGGYGFRCQGGGQQIRRIIAPTSHLFFGHHVRVNISGGTGGGQLNLGESVGLTHVNIAWYGDQQQIVVRNSAGTLLGITAIDTYLNNTWWFFEAEVVVHNSAGVVRIWVFGQSTPILELTGIDTQNGGSGVINGMHYFGSHGYLGSGHGLFDWDDMWMVDGNVVGSVHLGPTVVRARYPTSDGVPSQWDPTPGGNHFSTVDERPFVATDYVSTDVNGERDMYGTTDDGMTFNMMGIRTIGQMRKTDVGPAQARLTIKDGANYGVGLLRDLSDSSTIYADTFSERPGGAGDWNSVAANAALIGAEKVT